MGKSIECGGRRCEETDDKIRDVGLALCKRSTVVMRSSRYN